MSAELSIANGFAVYERMKNGWEFCDTSGNNDPEDACREVAARKWARGEHHLMACNGEGAWEFKVTLIVKPVPADQPEGDT